MLSYDRPAPSPSRLARTLNGGTEVERGGRRRPNRSVSFTTLRKERPLRRASASSFAATSSSNVNVVLMSS